MAQLVIATGPTGSGKTTWARKRGKAGNWAYAKSFDVAVGLLNEGYNVVLDNDYLTGHDVDIKAFKRERNYEEENNGL